MDILKTTLMPVRPALDLGTAAVNREEKSPGFGEVLKNAIQEVNGLQKQSEELKTQLLTGQVDDIHQVTIAAEKAELAFQLTLQIRNKVVEAYQEIMRMQV